MSVQPYSLPSRERATLPENDTPPFVPVAPAAADEPAPRVTVFGVLRDLVSLAKPRLSSLVLVTTAGGYLLAPGGGTLWPVVQVVAAVALLVASANTLNCVLEARIDQAMLRTRSRALPAGRIPLGLGLFHGLLLAAIALPWLSSVANPLAAALGALAHFSYVAIYTPLKRRSSLATIVGALPGALPPLIGWVAATGAIELPGLVLFGILFVWQIPHFLALSILLRDDYDRAGLKVLTLDGGDAMTRAHIVLWSVALIPMTMLLVPLGVADTRYGVGAGIAGLAFFAVALCGLLPGVGGQRRWSGGMFAASIVYLTALFVMLGAFAR